MGSINQNLRGIRIKIALFGTPKSGKYSYLQSTCKITSTQGNLQVFSDESGDIFSFVPIVRSVFSENINLQIKIMGARDKRGDGLVWQSIFKDVDGLIFICKAGSGYISQISEHLHKMQEYITHFGPRDYNVPVAIFYNKYDSDIPPEEIDKKVNTSHLRFFSGDLNDILPFISAIRYVVKEGLKKHQKDYEKLGGKKTIEDAFEIVEVLRPTGVNMAEGNVIINPPREDETEKAPEKNRTAPPPPVKAAYPQESLKETEIEELSELIENNKPDENTAKTRTPLFDFGDLLEKGSLLSKMINEIEQASQFFTLKASDIKKDYSSYEQIIEQAQSAYNMLKEENRSLSEKITQIKTELEDALKSAEEIKSLRAESESLKKRLEDSNKAAEQINNKVLELEKVVSEKDRLIQEKESLLVIKATEVDELKDRIKNLETEKERTAIEKRTQDDRITVLESKYKAADGERIRLSEEIARLQEEILACKAESEELQTNLGAKEREIDDLKNSYEKEIEKLKSEISTLSTELSAKSVPSNDEEVRRLSSELVNLQIELAQKDDQIKDLETKLSNKLKEIETLKVAKPPKASTTTETISPQMLAKTIISNLKLKYWDDMLNSLKDGTFQNKYKPIFAELKKAYNTKIPATVENRDTIFQTELTVLLEELKKNI